METRALDTNRPFEPGGLHKAFLDRGFSESFLAKKISWIEGRLASRHEALRSKEWRKAQRGR